MSFKLMTLATVVATCLGPQVYSESRVSIQTPALIEIPFSAALPAALADTVTLTFDDGPAFNGATSSILDTLRNEGVRATFFINTETGLTDLAHHPEAQNLLRRIVAEGHELGNHTARHVDLTTQSVAEGASDIDRVEEQVRNLTGGRVSYLTLFRAPYGHPFQPGDRWSQRGAFQMFSRVVAARAVHVGWTIDPSDWTGRPGAESRREILRQVDQEKRRGVIIMHAWEWETAKVLGTLIHDLRARGLRLLSCEDYLRALYGADSAKLIQRRRR